MALNTSRAVFLCALALVASCEFARGGIGYLQGTAFYAHDLSVGTTSDGSVFSVSDSAISSADNLSKLSFTLNRNNILIGGQAGNTSSAVARVGFVANSTTATIGLKPGTGVSQVDPAGGTSWPYSELKIDFRDATALRWEVTKPGFGPPSSKYASVTIGGTVGSEAGSFARFFANLAIYRNSISGANQIATINLDSGTISTAGTFSKTLTSSGPFSTNPVMGDQLLMIGTIVFQANNGGSPTDVSALNASFGSAVNNTSSSYVGPTTDNNWFTLANWSTNDDGVNPPTTPVIPSQIDDRAFFPTDGAVARTVTLNGNVTLGVLETSGSASTTIQTDGSSSLTLATESESQATIWQRNDNGEPTLNLNADVSLALGSNPFAFGRMVVVNDSENPIVFNQSLNGPGNSRLIKSGAGPMHVNGTVLFPGEINIDEGELKVNGTVAPGAPLSIRNGATLSGEGTIQRSVSFDNGSTLSPGNGIGTLTAADSLFMSAGSTYLLEMDVDGLVTSADQIDVTGAVFLGDEFNGYPLLQFVFVPAMPLPGPFTPQSFMIINNDASDAVSGRFDGFVDDIIVTAGLIEYSVNYNGGDGNDVVLTIHSVPEPSVLAVLAGAVALVLRRSKRERGSAD